MVVNGIRENSAASQRLERPVQSSPAPSVQAMGASGGVDTVQLSAEAVAAMSKAGSGGEATTSTLPKANTPPPSGKAGMAIAKYLKC